MSHNHSFTEDMGYVNIHGHDVKVYVCEKTEQLMIPIEELKSTGFRIYRKSQYNRLLIDDNQFSKEFDLYMLQSAQSYMLQSKIAFKETDIFESINKCKQIIKGSQSSSSPGKNESVSNNFGRSQVTENSPTDITITTNLRAPSSSTMQSLHNDNMFKGFTQMKRPSSFVESGELQPSSENRRSFDKNNFEQRNYNGPRNARAEARTSCEGANSFDKKSSPMGSCDSIPGKFGGRNDERRSNYNQIANNGVDGPHKPDVENLPKLVAISLDQPEHKVTITHIEDKPNCIWVQDSEKSDVLLEVTKKSEEESGRPQEKIQRYVFNKVYLAQQEDEWYRCKVYKFKPLTVVFIDFGNSAIVPEVKEASDELAKIPCLAVRITFSESHTQYRPQLYDTITVKIKRKFDSGTYAVDIMSKSETGTYVAEIANKEPQPSPAKAEPPAPPSPKTFFNKPEPIYKLENKQRVMIIGHTGPRLAIRTRECFEKLKEIDKALNEIDAKPLLKVEKGQLVLCNNDKLQRALVLNVNGKTVEVELLDHYEKIKVDLGQLQHISETLAKETPTFIMTPPIKGYNEGADGILNELIQKKSKPIIVLADNVFDLKIGEELLSEKFPKDPNCDRPLLKDFKFFKPKLGLSEYIFLLYRNTNEVYICCGEALDVYLCSIVKEDIDDIIPYEPMMGEICWGLYQENWSRCLILRQLKCKYEVQFVDFGNIEVTTSDQLRKLTDDGKVPPILAIRCRLVGLPALQNIDELVKQCVVENESYPINIKKFDGEVYEIEIPSVYKDLSS